MHPASSVPATIPVMLETSSQTSCLGTRCARSPRRTVADSARRNTHTPPLTGCRLSLKPWVACQTQRLRNKCHALHGCRCDRCNGLGNSRRFASRSETPTTTGSEEIACQPANQEKAAQPQRDCRHDAGAGRHMGPDTLNAGGKARRRCRLKRHRFLLRSTCPASRGKTPASRCARRARKWLAGGCRSARKAAAFQNCRKEHRKTNFLQRGEPTDRGHARILRRSRRWRSRCRQVPEGRYRSKNLKLAGKRTKLPVFSRAVA